MKREVKRNFIIILVSLIIGYLILAYIILPFSWKHYASRNKFSNAMLTYTKIGVPGDPINIIIIGSRKDLIHSMHAAGWYSADPFTLYSCLEIIGSVLFDFSDKNATMSLLYYEGRPQDLAFEKPHGPNATKRHHVRFWRTLNEREVHWVGSATFDRKIEFSRYTAQVTHQIAPDIDSERNYLIENLINIGVVSEINHIEGVGPTQKGYNGEGNFYFTDGKAILIKLKPITRNQKIIADPHH